jgi:hypothetical protein
MEILSKLTIVTITFNNETELDETLESCAFLRSNGCKQIVQNGGEFIRREETNLLVINESDAGIFDALDKGMEKANTDYVINIHSGDKFIGEIDDLIEILEDMEANNLDISLNDQLIPFGKFTQNRIHSSQMWKPFMLGFGVQPPHMPTIFRKDFAKNITYRNNEPVIGDFFQYVDLFKLGPKWKSHGKLIVRMAPGGNTTRGLKSVIYVSQQFIKSFGLFRGLLITLLRLPLKLLQAIRK